MVYKFCFLFLFFINFVQAQTYVKINGVTALALITNIGVEKSISKKMTFQLDVTASFWKSVKSAPLKFVMITPEIRYHFNEKFNGLYLGTHLGGSIFNLRKYGYSNLDIYQKGFNYYIGGTIGYQKKISEKWILDLFLGGGSIQSFYKGYYINTAIRSDEAQDFNKSGEFIPYRGGIMLCYEL